MDNASSLSERFSTPAMKPSDRRSVVTVSTARLAPPRPGPYLVVLALFGIGFGLMVGLPLVDGTQTEVRGAMGMAMFLGSVTGLIGTYLALVMVILASRLPLIERVVGHPQVMHWHRRLSPWTILLIELHVVLITLGYAGTAKAGVLSEFSSIVTTYPRMIPATAAWIIMTVVGVVSYPTIRRVLRRESWWGLHLLLYVALVLSFFHEVVLGPSFVGHPIAQWMWTGAWIVAAVLVLLFRVLMPASKSAYHRLRVAEISHEADGVTSLILEGEHLEELKVDGGQFFEWRFLNRDHWFGSHPFSLSARPQPPHLRLTVQSNGDFSSKIDRIKIGTPVFFEGPYGALTVHAQRQQRALLIAGGVGATAIRPLLEDMTQRQRPVVILRASSESDLIFRSEIQELVEERRGELRVVLGDRSKVKLSSMWKGIGDITKRDIYLAGSASFVGATLEALRAQGVASELIHSEAYEL
ncbi:MAG: ferredoxin reductase family protein [Acidimicrobiales bacterium]